MSWLIEHIGTIIILLTLAAVVGVAVAILIKDKKAGKSSCGGNCSHCAMGGSCHKKD